jgi:UDP-N-acetylmuramate dehydrogenase
MSKTSATLASMTTFGVGGPVVDLIETECNADAVADALRDLQGTVFVLGGGSNILACDEGFEGTVLRLRPVVLECSEAGRVVVDAAMPLSTVVLATFHAGLQGLERLAGIPGTIGGAVVQNAGAYGQTISDTVREVVCFDRWSADEVVFDRSACAFEYRSSLFKTSPDRWIVLRVDMDLRRESVAVVDRPDLLTHLGANRAGQFRIAEVVAATLAARAGKDHLVSASNRTAGSFFRNVVDFDERRLGAMQSTFAERTSALRAIHPFASRLTLASPSLDALYAGSLITTSFETDPDEFLPNKVLGHVRFGRSGPNTLINAGGATAEEILDVARMMRDRVIKTYAVELEPEIVLLGCSL